MSIASNFPALKPTLLLDFANTEELDPRITFTRASTATYYGTQTAKAEENLLIQSQTFDNSNWAKLRSTVSADATQAPDGTTTADALTQATGETSAGRVGQAVTSIAASYSFSVFAKPNGKNFITLAETLQSGSIVQTWFNVSTGAVGTTGAGHTATITAVANGFYRCSITLTATARSGQAYVYLGDTDGSSTVTDTGGVYIWGAQAEQRSAVTAYTVTTTQPITNYIPQLLTAASGVARRDHNPTTFESLGLEIEEQRTNLLTYSDQFANAAWTKTDATVAANTIVAPDGTLTGDKLLENTAASTHSIVSGITPTASTAYTGTVYIKAAERQFAFVGLNGGGIVSFASINLSTGAVSVATGTPTVSAASVGNGWYRVSVTATTASTVFLGFDVRIGTDGVWANRSYTGNGFSGIYIWGAQLEAGAFATSYIPTVASQVTRAADAASMTGTNFSSWYNQAEGTLYQEATPVEITTGTRYNLLATDGTVSNFIGIFKSTSNLGGIVLTQGTSQGSMFSGTVSTSTAFKSALGYKTNDCAFSTNTAIATDTSVTLPLLNQLQFGISLSGSLNCSIKKIAYYPLRVTNAQLQGLTS